jgi:glycosyltransferase involved in cell wall biosynthesis
MIKNNRKNNKNNKKIINPEVSICTPTFNRRPFYDMIIKCFLSQTYPREKMEWVIIDDGTDKIEDLVKDIPQVKYFKYDTKMTLGQKRNIMHEKALGQFIIYMDDDDFYPPERVSHAVETLKNNPSYMIAGSSEMYIYFKHINKMYQFGPYGPNHSTAATFAFRRELLKQTSFDNNAALAEEKHFLKNYTIPLIQLDSVKTILVFSHIHNTFDKKELLNQPENQYMKMSSKTIDDFIHDQSIKDFFVKDIDNILSSYNFGKVENKPEVLNQIKEIKDKKNQMIQQQIIQNVQQLNDINKNVEKILGEHKQLINILMKDNFDLKNKVSVLENNLKLISNTKL